MSKFASSRSEWEPFGPAACLRGGVAVIGMALLLAGCGQDQNPASSAPAKGQAPHASAPAAPSPSATAAAPQVRAPAAATSTAPAAQSPATEAQAKLAAMSVDELLTAARQAYAQHKLIAPAGDNAMEYYEEVLTRDPDNHVAKDALRETFPFSVPEVEKAIARNDFDEADREIALLGKADPTNYTLTLLRSKLDAQKRLSARQQLAAEQQAQQAAELVAIQEAAAARAAQEEAAAKAAAAAKVAAAARAPPGADTPARNQTSGYAVVEFTVQADGSVANPHIVDSSPRRVFDSAAINAVQNSKFDPALKDGEPVPAVIRRRIAFKFGG